MCITYITFYQLCYILLSMQQLVINPVRLSDYVCTLLFYYTSGLYKRNSFALTKF